MTHPARLEAETLLKLCERKNYKDSGPGGQHRNKVETGVELTHPDTGLKGRASERRAQKDNLRMALRRLRFVLALKHREPWQTRSDLWRSRCPNNKVICSQEHEDFPGLLAECLDALYHFDFDAKESAEALKISLSQLVKFLKKTPAALQQLNKKRAENNLGSLR
jgi:hypothetical protein